METFRPIDKKQKKRASQTLYDRILGRQARLTNTVA
jgi:hypothetical protein